MPFAVGVLTSDPNLLRCELHRLRAQVGLGSPDEPMGAAWFSDGNVLLQRYAPSARPASLDGLGGQLETEALLLHGAPLPLGMSLEENTQPFRYRGWIFACQTGLPASARLRDLALEGLPGHLQRAVRGATSAELGFALFLGGLRETGRPEDPLLDAKVVAEVLGASGRRLERLGLEAGARSVDLRLFATNGRSLAAVRIGDEPLSYRLLEGSPECERCHLGQSAEAEHLRRAHLRRRTVVAATDVREAQGWIQLQPGTGIAVDRNQDVSRVAV